MSTRSNIGYWMKNGRIRHIYCHSDGFPEGVGDTLYHHYKTWQKVKELIDLGDVSVLGEEIGEKHSFDDFWTRGEDAGEKNWTLFYGRDRGEKDTVAKVSGSEDSYVERASNSDAEYAYLFDPADNTWVMYDINKHKGWQSLAKVLGKGSLEDDEFSEVHGESNPYESKQKDKNKSDLQEAQMLTREDILKYGTKSEIKKLNEDNIPEPPATEEQLKKKEEEKAANGALLNIHLNLIDAAGLLGSLSMPKEYIDKNIVDLFNNIKSRISQLTLGQQRQEQEEL